MDDIVRSHQPCHSLGYLKFLDSYSLPPAREWHQRPKFDFFTRPSNNGANFDSHERFVLKNQSIESKLAFQRFLLGENVSLNGMMVRKGAAVQAGEFKGGERRFFSQGLILDNGKQPLGLLGIQNHAGMFHEMSDHVRAAMPPRHQPGTLAPHHLGRKRLIGGTIFQ